jgi:hypothetical protein
LDKLSIEIGMGELERLAVEHLNRLGLPHGEPLEPGRRSNRTLQTRLELLLFELKSVELLSNLQEPSIILQLAPPRLEDSIITLLLGEPLYDSPRREKVEEVVDTADLVVEDGRIYLIELVSIAAS